MAVDGDPRVFVELVWLIIFRTQKPNAKKNCPDWDALKFQGQRAERVLLYW